MSDTKRNKKKKIAHKTDSYLNAGVKLIHFILWLDELDIQSSINCNEISDERKKQMELKCCDHFIWFEIFGITVKKTSFGSLFHVSNV